MFSFRWSVLAALGLVACTTPPAMRAPQASQPAVREITLFSLNDFHGHVQARDPIPRMLTIPVQADRPEHSSPAGGLAYLTTLLNTRRAAVGANVLVGGGDLIGASPLDVSLQKDEPVIVALNRLGMVASALGNHEFDRGQEELLRKIEGRCPKEGCADPQFSGTQFTYLAANIHRKGAREPAFTPYLLREVGGIKLGLIAAITADTPNLVAGEALRGLEFEDEAEAVNRYVPELMQKGADAIVLLIHEGAEYHGAANDPSYACPGLSGALTRIVPRLDPAIRVVLSGHTHQAYTCRREGRLLVQGGSFGAYLSETHLYFDARTHALLDASAHNWPVDQQTLTADAQAGAWFDTVSARTQAVKERRVAQAPAVVRRAVPRGQFDSPLGNLIADAQLEAARHAGGADLALINEGGIRADLPGREAAGPVDIRYGDLHAVQPFRNTVLTLSMSGADLLEALRQQWLGRPDDAPKRLFVSANVHYHWSARTPLAERIADLRIDGQALDPARMYRVAVNNFLADGGDGFSAFRRATARQIVGEDLQLLEQYLSQPGAFALLRSAQARVQVD